MMSTKIFGGTIHCERGIAFLNEALEIIGKTMRKSAIFVLLSDS